MRPIISVIIPVFNRGWQLERALKSLTQQSYQHFEVVVCDDGSEEDIAFIVESYRNYLPAIKLIKISNSGGPARPRNIAVDAACADWLALLDSDDWWDKNKLSVISDFLDGSHDIIYHQLSVVRGFDRLPFGEKRSHIGQKIKSNPLEYMAVFGNPIPASSVVIKKSLYLEIGGMREGPEFVAIEDFFMWLDAAKAGAKFKFIEQTLGSYWVGKDSISIVSLSQVNAQKKIFDFLAPLITTSIKKFALSCHHYRLGSMYLKLNDYHSSLSYLRFASSLPTFYLRIGRIVKISIARAAIIKIGVLNFINGH